MISVLWVLWVCSSDFCFVDLYMPWIYICCGFIYAVDLCMLWIYICRGFIYADIYAVDLFIFCLIFFDFLCSEQSTSQRQKHILEEGKGQVGISKLCYYTWEVCFVLTWQYFFFPLSFMILVSLTLTLCSTFFSLYHS